MSLLLPTLVLCAPLVGSVPPSCIPELPTFGAADVSSHQETRAAEKEVVSPFKQLEFASGDDLTITADWYQANADANTPCIVLFHQAGFSRGAYREIAPKLVNLGFNCLAVDCRSGGQANDVLNETARRARERDGKNADFMAAYPDMLAAIKYASESRAKGKLIIWGSSYSAALVFKAAAELPDIVDGVLAFSPNARARWTGEWILESAKALKCPAFMTSAKREAGNWRAIYEAMSDEARSSYLPEVAGMHGSRALWEQTEGHEGYWKAVKAFLDKHFGDNAE